MRGAERSVGLGTALRKAFTLYATANSGSAIDAQGLVKLCGDAGLLQPTGVPHQMIVTSHLARWWAVLLSYAWWWGPCVHRAWLHSKLE